MTTIPRLLLTPGEPAGIGPELAVKIAHQPHPFELVVAANADLLKQTADKLNLSLNIEICAPEDLNPSSPRHAHTSGTLKVVDIPLGKTVSPGVLDSQNAPYVLATLETAASMALNSSVDAIVTGPVQKSVINDAGIAFSGHTEYFADHSGTEKVVMMLATDQLRVALATTHLPLKDVSAAITEASLTEVITILEREMREKFALPQPKILVCGLNPHAGEGGHLGNEEIDTIIPVLERCRAQGMQLIGPLPADTLFTPRHLDGADAVLAMYHDQGLPVLKYQGFGKAINITLGLPYIRTSVDHGTALDLAGKNRAGTGSLTAALDNAYALALKQRQSLNATLNAQPKEPS